MPSSQMQMNTAEPYIEQAFGAYLFIKYLFH